MLEFFIAALVIGIAPGPDNLFVLAQSATYGARLGFCIILGLCTGIAIHTCLLVAVLKKNPHQNVFLDGDFYKVVGYNYPKLSYIIAS